MKQVTPSTSARLPVVAACFLLLFNGSMAFQPPLSSTRALTMYPHTQIHHPLMRSDIFRLHFFFGPSEPDTKERELVFFRKLSTTANTDVKFESLVGFITTWSKKFEEDRKGMGLTTPVKVMLTLEDQEGDTSEHLAEKAGVRIVFQPTKTGYKSKGEEDASEKGTGDSKKKKDPPKEGGVEIRIEKLTNGEVQLVARRCDLDEDTVIKEMSEVAIVNQLKKAVEAWKKQ